MAGQSTAIPVVPASVTTGVSSPNPVASGAMNVGGIMPVVPNKVLIEREREAARQRQSLPVIQSLARYVRDCFSEARKAKEQDAEQRIFRSLRQRRGEYEASVMASIRKQGGSEIYMHLTSNKCRAASAWLRDVMSGTGGDKPWSIEPTPVPELSGDVMELITQQAAQQLEALNTVGADVSQAQLMELMTATKEQVMNKQLEQAREKAALMERKMEDQLQEGGWNQAITQFLDDIVTLPCAILKAPVIRKRPTLKWVQTESGWEMQTVDDLHLEIERVDPLDIYPAPYAVTIDDGYIIERHRLTRADLNALDGVEGYDSGAIKAVIAEYGRGGLNEWLSVDAERAALNGQTSVETSRANALIDALQFWGTVPGETLKEWGMTDEQVPDPSKDYSCEVWVIGGWVIKATLNIDPLGRKPYYKASYEELPGSFWGNSVCDQIRDIQDVCNSAARALVNNMSIASGPQVMYNIDRLPPGADLTEMHPWKIWQVTSDPYGNTAQKPVEFFQPNPMVTELIGVYDKFSALADEYSGIPRYMAGEAPTGGVGRTASGISMLMGNATKAIKQVVANIDAHVIAPLLRRYYFYNMRYGDDPEMKGDVNIVARGALAISTKDSIQVRRNEFLQIASNSQAINGIVGMEGLAAVLREVVKSLDMNPDSIVPSTEVLKARQLAIAAAQEQAAAAEAAANGEAPAAGPSPSGQELANGAPVTDNFSPQQSTM